MTKQLTAVFAAAAFVSASAFAGGDSVYPFSVSDSGPVLTAQQQEYQDQWQANRAESVGVAGRPGFAMETFTSGVHEVQTPSRGGPIDD